MASEEVFRCISKKGRTRFVLLCVLPPTILFTIFMVKIPTLQVFWMSMFKWGGIPTKRPLLGWAILRTLMEDGKFLQSFQNTVLLIVVVTLVTFGAGTGVRGDS